MDINEIARRAQFTAREKDVLTGGVAPDSDWLRLALADIHCELGEALQAWRSGDDGQKVLHIDSYVRERYKVIGDVAEPVCQTCEAQFDDDPPVRSPNLEGVFCSTSCLEAALSRCLRRKPIGLAVELADAVIRILEACEFRGIPIGEAIEHKMAYNDTREVGHGKAR